MASLENIEKEYPLHWLVWDNSFQQLHEEISKNVHDLEKQDPRGRTPLILAVTLGHLESARVLLDLGADVNRENKEGWTVVQEAVSSGDPGLVALIVGRRDQSRQVARSEGVPLLLARLHTAPDFYVEMKWEFTSWMPLVSRMCPSDTYRVYKRGASVRIDTTLLGFENGNWQRGNRTYIFKGQGTSATMLELDHETHQVWAERLEGGGNETASPPSSEQVSHRLTAPICTNYIDTEKISFERNKSGIWGWRSDKAETVGGRECKVFGASNVEFVTRTRTEHLSEGDKARARGPRGPRTPLHSFLGIADEEDKAACAPDDEEFNAIGNPCNITPEEYFSEEDLKGRDIGRPKEINTKIQKFRATLWLCETYPLQLQEQIMPILDLMASMSSPHFAKLKDFIQMQLPSGFPVKIEIPLFHVLNARITFGNIYGTECDVPHVSCIMEGDRQTCLIDEEIFQVPPEYEQQGAEDRRQFSFEDEDDLLQYAIQQSLIDAGSERDEVDIWEALKAQRPSRPTTPNLISEEERQLQRAIQASLASCRPGAPRGDEYDSPPSPATPVSTDPDLLEALMLSEREREADERERLREEAELAAILEMSLLDK